MHDLDRTQLEFTPESGAYEAEQYEYGEAEWHGESEVFNETETLELAAELLGVSSEAELDRFLGNLIKKAGQAVGGFIRSPVGQQLGGLLKGAAKQALPMIGSAIGGYVGGPGGAKLGGQAASAAGRIFGLELEGLSQEDREFETAKSFIQLAGKAAQTASASPAGANPSQIAQQALAAAARQYAPGLVQPRPGQPVAAAGTCPSCGHGGKPSGRWFRRGNTIVISGL